MPQLPFQVDGIQIEPGSGETLTITRDSSDGSLKFIDAILTSGVLLQNLVGVRNISGVFIVGKTSAPYSTIQSAIDAVPNTSSSALPSVIIVMPGVYTENISVQKDGLYIIGMGAKIINSGNSDTLSITVSDSVVPKQITLRGIEIECSENGKSCINANGAQIFATGNITVATAPLTPGNTITIGGVILTGVLGTRTSGLDNFSVSGGTTDTVATEIAAALNDTNNSFSGTISATPLGAVVTVKSNVAGAEGNSITLASNTGDITLSGASLAGGSSANTTALEEFLTVQDCLLKASGVGSFQISANTVNYIRVLGGTFEGSSSTSICSISNCSVFNLEHVAWVSDLELSYNTSNDVPSDSSCLYKASNCYISGDVTTNLIGAGNVEIIGCNAGVITAGGDQGFFIYRSDVGNINLSDTLGMFAYNSSRGSLTVAGGSPTFEEDLFIGSATFAASSSETVSFGYTQTDALYKVICTSSDANIICGVTSKGTIGFTIETSAPLTGTVDYILRR